jgi:hypothetical protein
MSSGVLHEWTLDTPTGDFYRDTLLALGAAQIPFLVGGAYALAHYVGITRQTKDLDIFVYPDDAAHALAVLAAAGYDTELTFPHWLGKACCGAECIDVIFSSGNGIATVDAEWFGHASPGNILGVPVRLCPPEEMLWSKAYVMERERYDGADVLHLLRACSAQLDWQRLLRRFAEHWPLLLSYLILFGFVYPAEHANIPAWVTQELLGRWQRGRHNPSDTPQLCQGTLLSRAQYQADIERWGYDDARLMPVGRLTAQDIAQWTAAIPDEKGEA